MKMHGDVIKSSKQASYKSIDSIHIHLVVYAYVLKQYSELNRQLCVDVRMVHAINNNQVNNK